MISRKTNNYIYLAAGLFNGESNIFNAYIAEALENNGYNCYLPQRDGFEVANYVKFLNTIKHLKSIDPILKQEMAHYIAYYLDIGHFMSRSIAVVGNVDEPVDDGTVIEMTYARICNLPVVGVRTDIRSPLGNVDGLISVNPFPVQQCDVYIKAKTPTGSLKDVYLIMDDLVKHILESLTQLLPVKKNKMRESSNTFIQNIVKGSDILFSDIYDIHSDESMVEISERYIKNKVFFASISPKIIHA